MKKKRVVLTFPHGLLDKPITYHLIKDYDLIVNILKAAVTPKEQGLLVLEIEGKEQNLNSGINYLKSNGVKIDLLKEDIKWDKDKCTHCTACVTVCPTEAFTLDRAVMRLEFDKNKCIGCGLCVTLCPYRAIEIVF
ncbi:MAG: 4Fe-4S binding protein [Candidatus Omnitrophica bacterium]|nr:4Fe-4S binding protein [Candidatus Omnitrophota bacterium]MBU1925799.1 4Fe-4S binding protein [Candidatus Omnitrophota bacterium]MBU2063006.1 4Fe-4S binding protein [Candidatus Omnitrophota bacterium]